VTTRPSPAPFPTAALYRLTFKTSGNYVLLENSIETGASQGWSVIDDQTGATASLDPQCIPQGLGPPWVLLSCAVLSGPRALELYSLTDGTQHAVTLSPGMPYCSSPPYDSEVTCSTGAVGADWLEWVASSYHHLPTSIYFQNLQTGELRRDPTNAHTVADLNSPALAHATCPGVQLLPDPDPSTSGWGALTVKGDFAVALAGDNSVILERCRTHLRRALTDGNTVVSYGLAVNTAMVVWQTVAGRLDGLFLPSLRPFTIPLPSSTATVGSLGLTSGGLYLNGDFTHGAVLRAPSPALLPFNSTRPTLSRIGSTLSCRLGRWRNADRFSYAWRVNGSAKADATPRLALPTSRKRRNVSCSVTAANALGATTASSAQLHMRPTATSSTRRLNR